MHPDSVIVDFIKDAEGNIVETILGIIVDGEVKSYKIPYIIADVFLSGMIHETALIVKEEQEQFMNVVAKEIEEICS